VHDDLRGADRRLIECKGTPRHQPAEPACRGNVSGQGSVLKSPWEERGVVSDGRKEGYVRAASLENADSRVLPSFGGEPRERVLSGFLRNPPSGATIRHTTPAGDHAADVMEVTPFKNFWTASHRTGVVSGLVDEVRALAGAGKIVA